MEFYASRNSLLLLSLAKVPGRVYGASRLPLLAVIASHDLLLGASKFYFLDDLDYLQYGGAVELQRKKGAKGEFTEVILTSVGEKLLSGRVAAQFSVSDREYLKELSGSRVERNLFELFEEACAFEPIEATTLGDLRAKLWQLSEAAYITLQIVYEDEAGGEREQEWVSAACVHLAKVLSWAAEEKWVGDETLVLANAVDFACTALTLNRYRYSYVFEDAFNFLVYFASKNGFSSEFNSVQGSRKQVVVKKSGFW